MEVDDIPPLTARWDSESESEGEDNTKKKINNNVFKRTKKPTGGEAAKILGNNAFVKEWRKERCGGEQRKVPRMEPSTEIGGFDDLLDKDARGKRKCCAVENEPVGETARQRRRRVWRDGQARKRLAVEGSIVAERNILSQDSKTSQLLDQQRQQHPPGNASDQQSAERECDAGESKHGEPLQKTFGERREETPWEPPRGEPPVHPTEWPTEPPLEQQPDTHPESTKGASAPPSETSRRERLVEASREEVLQKEALFKPAEQDDTSTVATEDMSDFEDSECSWEQLTEEQMEYCREHCTSGLERGNEPLHAGLAPPVLANGLRVCGQNKRQLRRENKALRIKRQEEQVEETYWSLYDGTFEMPEAKEELKKWRNMMCPKGLALHHPAAGKLLEYATGGCPTNTGKDWTVEQMRAAVERGPHVSALEPDAIEQLKGEIAEKVRIGQCRVVEWDSIKENPPRQLKVSPLAMIPHKSRKYRAILDLSFSLRLKNGGVVPSVNETTTLEAPAGAIDQMGHSLSRIIHAFAEAGEDDKVFMAKFDIKDGFWRLDCQEGEEWNFAYVLPQEEGEPTRLVVPTSLQMGWVESPPYFCAASETARDVAAQYVERPVGSLPQHKFTDFAMGNAEVKNLPKSGSNEGFKYFIDVYVDDFLPLAIASTQEQLQHVAEAVMHGIHDVFPADEVDENDPLSLKKLKKGDGEWALLKDLLGFEFDGVAKTMQLEEPKREFLLATLHKWLRTAERKDGRIPFNEFESVVAKIRHAFMSIPAGRGLLSPCNKLLRKRPTMVWLHRNVKLQHALRDCRTLLREATKEPTKCSELVTGPPGYVGVKDASVHGVGGIVIGEEKECIPTVFRMEWPEDIKQEVLKTNAGKGGTLTNSDLEMAGLLLLWLVMEEVCDFQPGDHVALFSDNSPTVNWVRRMAARGSMVADQLLRALALRLKQNHVSPLTPLHIAGKKNEMTDIPSRSFGSEKKWFCETEEDLLKLFNSSFPLPNQNSWTVFWPSREIESRVISVLRQEVSRMEEWRRLPKRGRHIGSIGSPTAKLWEWTLTFRGQSSGGANESSMHSQEVCDQESLVEEERSRLARLQRRSRPLTRRSCWPQTRAL